MKKLLLTFFTGFCILVIMAGKTEAYLDPSVVTYFTQIFVGIAVASGAAFAIFWKKIRLFFKKKFKK